MSKHLLTNGFLSIALFLGITSSRAQSGPVKIQAMQHIKIVKTPAKGEEQINAQLVSMDASIKAINDDIQKAQTDMASLKTIQQNLQGQLDSMNEMSEMTSMRLQMAMDRRSKFVETLSNILKKINDTQNAIVQNMK